MEDDAIAHRSGRVDSPAMLLFKQLAAGTVAGVCQVLAGHPFDTIKVRLQMPSAPYSGIWDVVTSTVKNEGFRGFYKGMLSPLSGIAAVNALIFGSYSQMKGHYEKKRIEDGTTHKMRHGLLPISDIAVCGAFAGLTNSFVAGPVELFKTQMQVQYSNSDISKHYKGSFDAAAKIARQSGFRKWFMGLDATIIREVPGTAGYYAMYEVCKRTMAGSTMHPNDLSLLKILAAGSIAGIGYWLCCYPFDIIKSRIQAQPTYLTPQYHSWLHCVKTLYAQNGIRGFYRGFDAAILRTIPASAVTFAAFEFTIQYLKKI